MNTARTIMNGLRLALFALGYGLTGALVGGTLNRVMVAEMDLPVSLVGLFFAAPLFILPLRAWLGYLTDAHPLRGLRREPYMIAGTLLASLSVIGAILLLQAFSGSLALLAVTVMLAFLLHELGRNLAHNSFQALLADKYSQETRGRAITLFEVATLLGLVMGAGGIASGLEDYTAPRLVQITVMVAAVTFMLALAAALGSEPRSTDTPQLSAAARATPFRQVIKAAWQDPPVRQFFILIVLVVLGTLAQDVILEPYGALVLEMDVDATSRLTAFWGVGVMLSMLLSAALLLRWLGHTRLMRVGVALTLLIFAGVIVSGATGSAGLFRGLVFFMGLGTGLAGAGLLGGIVNFTTPERSGLLMGIWGIAMVAGRSLGSLFSGIIVDLVGLLGGTDLAAYALVFTLEGLLLAAALVISLRLKPDDSVVYHFGDAPDGMAAMQAAD